MRILTLTAISLSTLALSGNAFAQNYNHYNSSYNAHEACKTNENKQKLLGGGIGAVAGAVLGSQVSGRGARTEGSAIGAVIGGLAGAGIADKRIDCDPVYSTQPQPVYYPSQPSTYQTVPARHTSTKRYPVTTRVSSHPVYSNPGYSTTQNQNASYHTAQSQPHRVRSYPTTNHQNNYHRSTYVTSQNRHVVQTRSTKHYHGKYECHTHH
ncbi:outer membrane protein with glycine zipper [Litorimonas taeanensis]|uniref:Outer membrane protein with glycine zipper n=1 Tax=Litorimonas taeanensis TaxID=568099 RepID=A0A420WKE4_9PROT|nr:glycine zipper 2TM domain-containing protein [Litorimonas taeanensis]RKQ71478.1 outer membrane protein with glycine zipper [Litorimonas taeanensis]